MAPKSFIYNYKGIVDLQWKNQEDIARVGTAVLRGAAALDEYRKLTKEPILIKQQFVSSEDGGVKKITTETTESLEANRREVNKWSKSLDGSVTRLRQQINEAKQARDGIARYRQEITRNGKAITVQNLQWTQANNKVQEYIKKLRDAQATRFLNIKLPDFSGLLSVGNKVTQIAAAFTAVGLAIAGVVSAAALFINRAKQITQLRLSLENFGVTNQESAAVLKQAAVQALTYGASLAQVERAYKRLTPVILATGGSLKETDDVISSLVARTSILGLNTEQSGRYIEAFAQVLGKGKLQAEELNQQLSELDGALRSELAAFLEAELGITNLERALKQGAITSDIFKRFIIQAGEAAKNRLAVDITTVQQSIIGLDKSIKQLNVQQIENTASTLNTLTLGNLANTFAEFGRYLGAIQVAISQFFLTLSNRFPVLTSQFQKLLKSLGQGLFIVVTGFLNGLTVILVALEEIFKATGAAIDTLNTKGQKLLGWLDLVTDPVGVLAEKLGLATNRSKDFGSIIQRAFNPLAKIKSLIIGDNIGFDQLTATVAQGTDEILGFGQVLQTLGAGFSGVNKGTKQAKTNFDKAAEAFSSAADGAKKLIDAQKSIVEAPVKFLELKLKNITREYDRQIDQVNRIKDGWEKALTAIDAVIEAEVRRQYGSSSRKEDLYIEQQLLQLSIKRNQAIVKQTRFGTEENLQARKTLNTDRLSLLTVNEKLKRFDQIEEAQDGVTKAQADGAQLESTRAQAAGKYEEALVDAESAAEAVLDALQKQINTLGLAEDKATVLGQTFGKNVNDVIKDAIDLVQTLGTKLEELAKDPINIKIQSSSNDWGLGAAANNLLKRASGGPVSSGTKYTVNELGKEAFLSASGRLSMINAPAWGQWRAPSSGTIIPAHLAAQLDIPTGGVNLNAGSKSRGVVSSVTSGIGISYAMRQLSQAQQVQAVELGRLSRAVDRMTDKDWSVDVNINGNNPLLDRLRRTR